MTSQTHQKIPWHPNRSKLFHDPPNWSANFHDPQIQGTSQIKGLPFESVLHKEANISRVPFKGQYHEWKRGACDTAFLRDMRSICHQRHSKKRYSWWEKFKIILSLGYDAVKWWTIPSDSLQHCLHGANIFYKAVDGFGQSHYGLKKSSNRHCKEPCALSMGSPGRESKEK